MVQDAVLMGFCLWKLDRNYFLWLWVPETLVRIQPSRQRVIVYEAKRKRTFGKKEWVFNIINLFPNGATLSSMKYK